MGDTLRAPFGVEDGSFRRVHGVLDIILSEQVPEFSPAVEPEVTIDERVLQDDYYASGAELTSHRIFDPRDGGLKI